MDPRGFRTLVARAGWTTETPRTPTRTTRTDSPDSTTDTQTDNPTTSTDSARTTPDACPDHPGAPTIGGRCGDCTIHPDDPAERHEWRQRALRAEATIERMKRTNRMVNGGARQERERAERAEATLTRVRQLHDNLAADTAIATTDDEITRGQAAERIATALDGAPTEPHPNEADPHQAYPDRPCGEDRPAHSAHRYMLGGRLYQCPGAMPDTTGAAEQAEAERDQAYAERAALLAWISALHPANAVITPADDIDEPGWQLLYLLISGWQMSWHIAPRDTELFGHVEHVAPGDPRAQWDGHSTTEKYERIREHTARLSEARASTVRIEISPAPAHVVDAIRQVRRDGGLPPHRR
ncbi:hypothetical protein [Streptomyces malaysiensis]|uniref:hypothetical protein n=1 Tax=Streptomyces malaysiensis TaxID=92644 RepID=UPI001651A33E|nr:hypothetical protein [Streptomyces malaysiensis]